MPMTLIDFSGQNLTGQDFSGQNLAEANFSDANLTEAVFNGANLARADFSGTLLPRASFRGADLTGASFAGAHFSGTSFRRANLSRANLSDVYCSDQGAQATVTAYENLTNFGGAKLIQSCMHRAQLQGAFFRGVNFSEWNLCLSTTRLIHHISI